MSRNDRPADRPRRRSVLGVGTAAGAAFAAALISMGTAPIAGADDDPFFDLFGSSGVNSWTPGADALLPATLAGSFDQSVDSFQTMETDQDPFTDLTVAYDQLFNVHDFSGSGDPDHGAGGDPITLLGDLAVGYDYMLSLIPGLGASIDSFDDSLFGGLP